MDMRPNARQQELIDIARALAMEKFEPRAAEYDREARFPFEDYADLRDVGFLGLCVPEEYGGLGADLETYCLVVEEIAKGNASTALTFNMHCLTMLMTGEMADAHEMSDEKRARHAELRARNFREQSTRLRRPFRRPCLSSNRAYRRQDLNYLLPHGSSCRIGNSPPNLPRARSLRTRRICDRAGFRTICERCRFAVSSRSCQRPCHRTLATAIARYGSPFVRR